MQGLITCMNDFYAQLIKITIALSAELVCLHSPEETSIFGHEVTQSEI